MSSGEKPVTYCEHPGTIRVAGISKPLRLAQCAQGLMTAAISPIEFFYIGGNAGQQATKAMTILAYQIKCETNGNVEALFHPTRVVTCTVDEGQHEKEKDATVWRLVLVTK